MNVKKARRASALGRVLGVLALLAVMLVGATVTAAPALADDGGYPNASMQCVHAPYATTGSGYWCSGYEWGTIRDNTSGASIYSSRGYAYRNCTDYVAWKLESLGVSASLVQGRGNGGQWDDSSASVTVTSVPEKGDAAVIEPTGSNAYGHVAFVEDVQVVSGSYQVKVSQYNWGQDGNYSITGWQAASTYGNFVDFNEVGVPLGSSSGYEVAFQANSGQLWMYGTALGTINTGLGMMSGTSPAIAKVSDGYEIAFQSNSGHLWVYGAAGSADTGLGMMAGTSPAITALSGGGYEVAFVANTGALWLYGTAGSSNTGLGVASGTSPAIAAVTGGYEVAFNSGNLWVYGVAATANTGFGLASGTSPSIIGFSGGGFEANFNSGTLWDYGTAATANTGYGVANGTSPAITAATGGYETAFNSGTLWLHGVAASADTGLGLAVGTSPAIAAIPGGYQAAFNSGTLWVYGTAGSANSGLGMMAGTSPSIAGS